MANQANQAKQTEQTERPNVDKLVIQFSKALNMNLAELPEPLQKPLGGPWMTLGYFDAMQIYPLPIEEGDSWLQAIWKHNVRLSENLDGSYYVHPFYITADFGQQEAAYQAFWERQADYLFVTLVQGAQTSAGENGASLDELEKQTEAYLKKIVKDDISYVLYRTLELSDIIILWKSASPMKFLRILQDLYYQPFIGDLNTFCGVQYSALKRAAGVKQAAPDKMHEEISRVEMRFIVRDMNLLKPVFQMIERDLHTETYFVTGIEDFHAIWSEISEHDFLKVLYHCYFDPESNQDFRQAFRETEVHIGMPSRLSAEGIRKQTPVSNITKRCEELLRTFNQLHVPNKGDNELFDYSWMKAVRSQLNAMLDMSRNYVVDGLCYLVLDSVCLFCEEAGRLLSLEQPLSSKQLEGLQRFVRGWGILMEQAGRSDGRFTHVPGFSPPLYDIPAKLLEFYLAFAKMCCRTLQAGGEDHSRFALLIVPKLCRRIKVDSVFHYREPPCERLLYVDIPLDTLYDPFTTLCQLTHEISHFCGDVWRDRPMRANYFLSICAYELAASLNLDTKNGVKQIYNDLRERCLPGQKKLYLKDLVATTPRVIWDMIDDDTQVERWIDAARLDRDFRGGWNEYIWKSEVCAGREIIRSGWSTGPFFQGISEVAELFSECYADVSMIHTLKLSLTEYLNLTQQELRFFQHPENLTEAERNAYYSSVQRWSLVQQAAFPDLPLKEAFANENVRQFYLDTQKVRRYMQSASEEIYAQPEVRYYLNAETLNLIVQYLRQCSDHMKMSFPVGDDSRQSLSILRDVFDRIARKHQVSCESFERLISIYRKGLI